METAVGQIPQLSSQLHLKDHIGRWKARWGIGRHSYIVPPGLYAIGHPNADSPVVVTANYKMSYDLVRSHLKGRNIWMLVLETYGINVWCAAGKGSFGTAELVKRIQDTRLDELVRHRTLILPILGAPGIAAHEVVRATGFNISYATIRISDLPEFLDNNFQTSAAMKQLTFSIGERVALIPVELVQSFKFSLPACPLLLLIGWWFGGLFLGLAGCAALLGAVGTGTILVPILLPWLPGSSFAFKGLLVGAAWSSFWSWTMWGNFSISAIIGTCLALTAISSFYAMNFTGSTPFTSISGVRKEMNIALPAILAAISAAALLWGWALFS